MIIFLLNIKFNCITKEWKAIDQYLFVLRRFKNLINRHLPIELWHLNVKQKYAKSQDQFPNVDWLSHHIPKTAGSSLHQAFDAAYQHKHIQEVYPFNDLPKRLASGQPVWVPKGTRLIHGHFRPHKNHKSQFPNAGRLVWIRDPIERNISLLSHLLEEEMLQTRFIDFKLKYTRNKYSINDLFSLMIEDESLYSATRIYESYLKGFRKSDFAFVGKVSQYKEELKRLEGIMKIPLQEYHKGINTRKMIPNIDTEYFRLKLKSEYELLEEWI